MSPGRLLPGLPVAVDYWKPVQKHEQFQKWVYFLTNTEPENTQGLESTLKHSIYTSRTNGEFLIEALKIDRQRCKILELNSLYRITLPPKGGEKELFKFTVMLFEANNVKGAVMLLFEGDFGRVLYSGNFRFYEGILQIPELKKLNENRNLDVLYVDNTHEEVGSGLPTRGKAFHATLDIIEDHKYHRILIASQCTGMEDILIGVARTLTSKIYVPDHLKDTNKVFGLPDVATSDQSSTNIWFCDLNEITDSMLREKNLSHPTIVILLGKSGALQSANLREMDYVRIVPFSNHSSSFELVKLFNFLRPKKVERIFEKQAQSGKSVIDSYLAVGQLLSCGSEDDSADDSQSADEESSPSDTDGPMTSVKEKNSARGVQLKAPATPDELIDEINDFMNRNGDEIIYTAEFSEKLLDIGRALTSLTGIRVPDGDLSQTLRSKK